MSYADILPKNIPFTLFFDNFFTSIDLLFDLKVRNIQASGTIRANRVDKTCPLTDPKKIMKTKKRGYWEYATDETTGICFKFYCAYN